MKSLKLQEVAKHTQPDDLWIIVDDQVYDISSFAPTHPGGIEILLKYAGQNASEPYNEVHAPSLIRTTLPPEKHIGQLIEVERASSRVASANQTRSRNESRQTQKPSLDSLISTHDFENVASQVFTPKAWAFVSSAATDLHTKGRNASSYASIGLRPRVLRDVAQVDLSTRMLGCDIRLPLFASPTAMAKLFHPEGERDIGRACKHAGIAQGVSTSASFPIEDIVSAIHTTKSEKPFDVPVFFQLYVDKDRDKSKKLLQRAQQSGAKGILLTVDAPIPGKREADERVRVDGSISSPISGAKAKNDSKGGAIGRVMAGYIDASLSWKDLSWLRGCVPGLPIILKGIQTCDDAILAMQAGVEAIVISNHGGRSLDTSPATIETLLELRRNCQEVFQKMEVFVDGGISRGTDIFKALCLGARAVGLGRGCLYGLTYGSEGVERYIEILRDELETTMKMCGVTRLDQLHPGYVNTLALDSVIPPRDHFERNSRVMSRL